MSASREKKTRSDSTYVQRRNNREEDKDRRKHILYGIAGGVVAVLAIALLVWDSGFFQKRSTAVTIDGEDYGPAVVQYYYQTALNNAYYGSVMGDTNYASFDYNADPAEQTYDEETGQTWRDFLLDQAIDDLTQVTVLVHAAEAEGYTLTQKDQAYLESELATLDSTWRSSGSYDSLSSYLKLNYGSYMDEDTFQSLYADQVLADSYRQHYQDSLTYTDEETEAYYNEHTNDLDTFGYTVFTVQATVEEQTDEEGNTVEMTDEEKTAALETAKADALATAQAIQSRLTNGEDAQARPTSTPTRCTAPPSTPPPWAPPSPLLPMPTGCMTPPARAGTSPWPSWTAVRAAHTTTMWSSLTAGPGTTPPPPMCATS